VVFAGGAFLTRAALASPTTGAFATLTTARRAGTTLWALTTFARWSTAGAVITFFKAGRAFSLWFVLSGGVVRTLVGMNGGRMVRMIFRVILGMPPGRFLLLSSTHDTFEPGFQATEQGGFFRGMFGAAGGGHSRFRR
jgi:hypothetical protein